LFGPDTPAGDRLDAMARFFTSLSDDMAGGTTAAAFADSLTVTAALGYAGRPLSTGTLAVALGWSVERTTAALLGARDHPDVIDPVVLTVPAPGRYAVTARADRLTEDQRTALREIVKTV
jgi:hypothetical protein